MKRIGIVSVLHFFIDMLCSFSVFTVFTSKMEAATVYVVYNFCAFALQMPLGAFLDFISSFGSEALVLTASKKAGGTSSTNSRKESIAFIFTSAGVIITILGSFSFVWLLGLGNALFHVGGGVLAIEEDNERKMKGKGLGMFVAPGAIGLFLGSQIKSLGDSAFGAALITGLVIGIMAILALFTAILFRNVYSGKIGEALACGDSKGLSNGNQNAKTPRLYIAILCCFICVCLRSYVGMASVFPWKVGFGLSLISVCCVAGGKTAGGFLGAKLGYLRAAGFSLLAAAACFVISGNALAGLLALFFFNMSMPITLYSLAKRMPEMPGLAFGILTFGLFIGFLPWFGNLFPVPPTPALGCVGSIVSLLVLLPVLAANGGLQAESEAETNEGPSKAISTGPIAKADER